jgi:hypothetical protein
MQTSPVHASPVHASPVHASPVEASHSAARPSRILTLDIMRGYFVLILAAVHLNYVPSVFGWFDGRGQLWVSEAEGFFFISGMLVAMLRRRDVEQAGMATAARRSWRRAFQLYVVACTLTIFYTAIGQATVHLGWNGAKADLDETSAWWRIVYNTLTLRYVYGWADFLTFYVPLFVVAPLLVWLMSHRLTWLVVLLSLSAFASMTFISWGAAGAFVQWQVHFVLGCVFGFHFAALSRWLGSLRVKVRRGLYVGAVLGAGLVYAGGMMTLLDPSLRPSSPLYEELLENNRLGLLRPVLLLVMFAGVYVLIEKLQRPIMATVGRLLTQFGRNSLYVYVVQSALVFAVPFVTPSRGLVFDTVLDLALIAVVWLGLRKRILLNLIPR